MQLQERLRFPLPWSPARPRAVTAQAAHDTLPAKVLPFSVHVEKIENGTPYRWKSDESGRAPGSDQIQAINRLLLEEAVQLLHNLLLILLVVRVAQA